MLLTVGKNDKPHLQLLNNLLPKNPSPKNPEMAKLLKNQPIYLNLMLADLRVVLLPLQINSLELLGMVSHKMSKITIFGHNHFQKKFVSKFDIFTKENSITIKVDFRLK